jgi:hypothetical protein
MDNDNRDGRALRHKPDGASAKQSDEGPDRKRDEKRADRNQFPGANELIGKRAPRLLFNHRFLLLFWVIIVSERPQPTS